MWIKKGDQVEVTAGNGSRKKDESPEARKVLRVLPGGQKVVIEGVNRVYKHVKRGHPKSPQGGRLSLEMPISIANVQLFCTKCSRGVRVGVKFNDDGSKIRCCKKCAADLGKISGPNPKYAKK